MSEPPVWAKPYSMHHNASSSRLTFISLAGLMVSLAFHLALCLPCNRVRLCSSGLNFISIADRPLPVLSQWMSSLRSSSGLQQQLPEISQEGIVGVTVVPALTCRDLCPAPSNRSIRTTLYNIQINLDFRAIGTMARHCEA